MSKNQHRWRKSVDPKICSVLDDAAALLEWAWGLDIKNPKSFPVDTDRVFYEVRGRIEECQRRRLPEITSKPFRLPKFRPPKQFSDLIDEKLVKFAYENQNADSYQEALRLAISGDRLAGLAFRKIHNAVKIAFLMAHFSEDIAPKPRVHFLHRNLLEISDLVDELRDMTPAGIVEFLDDLCPCGKEHTPEAIRKLRQRAVRRELKP